MSACWVAVLNTQSLNHQLHWLLYTQSTTFSCTVLFTAAAEQQQHSRLFARCNGVICCVMQGSCRPRVQQAAQQQCSECEGEVSGGLVGS